jgi:hypothetical protein
LILAYVLKKFQTSRYTQSRPVEALSRTILDIILLDRLESLQDQYGHYLLQLDPEVNISVTTDGVDNTKEIIQGRMDWALNYDAKKSGSILIVWEAKRLGLAASGLPQLLVYMTGVLQSRRDRINQTVWGMLSDSGTFQFAFLDDKKKFYTSRLYRWAQDQSTILAYIDAILFDAIQSSPHTTPTKTENATLRNYQRYLKARWRFGEEPEVKAVDGIDPESIVDVVKEGNDIVLRPVRKKEAETEKGRSWG